MSKPSILLINRVYPPDRGATGRMMQDLANALIENGWRVTILSVTNTKAEFDAQQVPVHHAVYTHIKAKGTFGYGWALMKLAMAAIKLPKHDVVLTMTDPPMLMRVGKFVAGFKKSKHVHWCQDMYPDLLDAINVKMPKFFQRWLDKAAIKSYRKADCIVVIGNCMKARFKDKKISPLKLETIPNWTDFEVLSPSVGDNYQDLPEKIKAVAKKPEEMFRDDSPKFKILYAGTIGLAHPMKIIVDAAALLAEHKEIEFVFVGDQHAHSRLAKERAKLGLENIKFLPFQPIEKYRDILESGDLHLVTMRNEAEGMLVPCKFYSGLTVGRPTIFAGPEHSEIATAINYFKAGTVVAPDNAEALAAAIYKYRHDGEAWFNAQEGALQAAQAYHPSQSLQSWVDLLEGVVNNG